MGLADDIKTLLAATASLTSVFSTRIVTWDDVGQMGLTRDSYAPAFVTNTMRMNYTILIRERTMNVTPQVHDQAAQYQSGIQAVEITFYGDAANAYDALETAQTTVYGLLQGNRVNNRTLLWRMDERNVRDKPLGANAIMVIYDAFGIKKPT